MEEIVRVTLKDLYKSQQETREELAGAIHDGIDTVRTEILRYVETLKENAEKDHAEFRQRFDQIENTQQLQGTAITTMQTLLNERSETKREQREVRLSRDREIFKFALTVIGTLITTGVITIAGAIWSRASIQWPDPAVVQTAVPVIAPMATPTLILSPTVNPTASPTATEEPSQTGGGDLPTVTPIRPTPTRVILVTPDETVGAPSTCPWFGKGAFKPDPPARYSLTKANSQNVRDAPAVNNLWGKTVGSISRLDGQGKPASYRIYWQIGDWLAIDNTCQQWVAGWLGQISTGN